MNILLKTTKSVLLSSFLVAGISLTIPVQKAQASELETSGAGLKTTVAGHGSARFDWFASARNTKRVRVIKISNRPSLGHGTWICSAAGFGKQARCFQR